MERAGQLRTMLVDFALSPRFDRELSAAIARKYPDGVLPNDAAFSALVDYFAVQHRLESGGTVVDAFVVAHPELTDEDRDMLLGWRDPVEGTFEVAGKEGDTVVLFNFVDELTYRVRSDVGGEAFASLHEGMIVLARLVRAGHEWMISADLAVFPASAREQVLATTAQQALRNPERVFRNPAKLAEARRILARHREAFVEVFGTDLIVVPTDDVPDKLQELHRRLLARTEPGDKPPEPLGIPVDILSADTVALHFVEGRGLTFYPNYHLLDEVFADPALVVRGRYREALSDFLRDPDTSPEPLRRLAARDAGKASEVFTKLLRPKRGFSWETDGDALLRRYKPGYFDGSQLPGTVPLSDALTEALRRTDATSS